MATERARLAVQDSVGSFLMSMTLRWMVVEGRLSRSDTCCVIPGAITSSPRLDMTSIALLGLGLPGTAGSSRCCV